MTGHRLTKLAVAIGLSVATTSALASPQTFMSARSFAMGGTGVAVANPSDSAAVNPALLAGNHHTWSDDFGLQLLSVNAQVADEEDTADQVDDIQDTIDDLEQAINSLDQPEAQTQAGKLREQLQAIDRDTARANGGLGFALAFPGKDLAAALFINGNLTASIRGEYDDSDDARLQAIENGTLIPGATDDLESRGRILASAVSEIGISFAKEFEIAGGHRLQLGVSPKYVNLQTFQYTETVSGFDDNDFDNDRYQTDKSGFNMDIGAAYAFGNEKRWNAGIVVKNLIPMELDSAASRPDLGEEVRTLELNPMATAGIAHKSEYHVVTAEIDLTKKEAFGFEDDTQWAALGAEFDAFRYAQLRVGVRHNLASNDDNRGIEENTQFTAGLGLNLSGVRLDIGALYSDADVGAALELGSAF